MFLKHFFAQIWDLWAMISILKPTCFFPLKSALILRKDSFSGQNSIEIILKVLYNEIKMLHLGVPSKGTCPIFYALVHGIFVPNFRIFFSKKKQQNYQKVRKFWVLWEKNKFLLKIIIWQYHVMYNIYSQSFLIKYFNVDIGPLQANFLICML